MSFSHLAGLDGEHHIPLSTDEEGLLGRECPNDGCEGYFKIKPGTGLTGDDLKCHCPYCGYIGEPSDFATQDQIEYAKSVFLRMVNDALRADTRDWDRQLRSSSRNSFLKMSVKFEGGHHPIHYYHEKELETKVTCDSCTLDYAIYGVFAYCPDCGTHNSLQILKKNLELANKELALSGTTDDADLSSHLVAEALKTAVSAFDGFGREVSSLNAGSATDPKKAEATSFQNLLKARSSVNSIFGYDLAGGLDSGEWEFLIKMFQKRHLLVHTMGVIDQQYVDITHDHTAVVGRKIGVGADEVKKVIGLVLKIGTGFVEHFRPPAGEESGATS